jgi:mRNA interferase RelE/StbE
LPRVFLTRSARQALVRLEEPLADAVVEALDDLRHDLTAGSELRGRLSGLYSLRVGAYRVIYETRREGTIRVLAIRHRASAYGVDPRG